MISKSLVSDSVVLLLLIGVLLAPPGHAAGDRERERVTTEGEGEVEIRDKDLSAARAEALEDGLRKAFENALFEILPSGISLAWRKNILDQLSGRMRKYLLQYRVLSEMPAVHVFFINVEATFAASLIREDLVKLGFAGTEEQRVEPLELFVRVEEVSSFLGYQQLMQGFQRLAYVKSVSPHEVFGTTVLLRLEYERDLEDLLETLWSWRSEEFAFRVDQVKDREITVSLVRTNAWADPPSPFRAVPPAELPREWQ